MKSYGLTYGHLRVFLPVQDQYRRLHLPCKRDRAIPGMRVWPCTFPRSASTQHTLKIWHAAGHHHHSPVAFFTVGYECISHMRPIRRDIKPLGNSEIDYDLRREFRHICSSSAFDVIIQLPLLIASTTFAPALPRPPISTAGRVNGRVSSRTIFSP